jgi:hypothetical protein
MTAIASEGPRFDIGRVVNRTFGAIGRNFASFGLLALVFAAVPGALIQWSELRVIAGGVNFDGPTMALLSGAGLLAFFGAFILQAALVHGTVADLNGRRASIGEMLATGLRYFLPLLAIAILMSIALCFGIILLVVPGVLMALAWCVVVPAEVVERSGVFGAFGRSAELTRNHRGSIFGLFAIYMIACLIVGMVIGAILGVTGLASGVRVVSLPQAIIMGLVQGVQTLVGSAGAASIYYELRSAKEGVGPEHLASVFD